MREWDRFKSVPLALVFELPPLGCVRAYEIGSLSDTAVGTEERLNFFSFGPRKLKGVLQADMAVKVG